MTETKKESTVMTVKELCEILEIGKPAAYCLIALIGKPTTLQLGSGVPRQRLRKSWDYGQKGALDGYISRFCSGNIRIWLMISCIRRKMVYTKTISHRIHGTQ